MTIRTSCGFVAACCQRILPVRRALRRADVAQRRMPHGFAAACCHWVCPSGDARGERGRCPASDA
eukprot:826874-Lingulodinium_polyedra.AAC.1